MKKEERERITVEKLKR
jgi:hypothetical protein